MPVKTVIAHRDGARITQIRRGQARWRGLSWEPVALSSRAFRKTAPESTLLP